MTSSEYLQSVVYFFDRRGWNTVPSKVRNGVYLIAGRKNTTDGLFDMFIMVVDYPESQVTFDHLKYLLRTAEKRDIETVVLTSNVNIPNEVRQSAKNNGITLIAQNTILSETHIETNNSITNQSDSNNTKTNHNGAYEVYGSRVRLVLNGVGGLFLRLVGIWLLVIGLNWFATLVAIFSVPLGLFGASIMFYQAIKNEPILRITNDGISFNKPVGKSEFYPWENIEEIRCVEQKSNRITLTHLQIRLAEMNTEGMLQEILAQADKLAAGDEADAYYIPIESFGVDFEEVTEAVTQYSNIQVSDERNINNNDL